MARFTDENAKPQIDVPHPPLSSMPSPDGRPLRVWIALVVALLIAGSVTVFAQAQVSGQAGPTLTTDKADYKPGEVVHVSGTGFEPNTKYALPVQRPNGSIVLIDPDTHTATPGW